MNEEEAEKLAKEMSEEDAKKLVKEMMVCHIEESIKNKEMEKEIIMKSISNGFLEGYTQAMRDLSNGSPKTLDDALIEAKICETMRGVTELYNVYIEKLKGDLEDAKAGN